MSHSFLAFPNPFYSTYRRLTKRYERQVVVLPALATGRVARVWFDRGPRLEDRHCSTSCPGDGRDRLELCCDRSCKGHGVSPAAQLLQATVISSCFEISICTQTYVITQKPTVESAHELAHLNSGSAVGSVLPGEDKIHSPNE